MQCFAVANRPCRIVSKAIWLPDRKEENEMKKSRSIFCSGKCDIGINTQAYSVASTPGHLPATELISWLWPELILFEMNIYIYIKITIYSKLRHTNRFVITFKSNSFPFLPHPINLLYAAEEKNRS